MAEKNIYQRMSAITAELTAVAKNLSVGEGRNSYKAVGEADVLAAVKPLEAKHGIYSYPSSRRIIEQGIVDREKTYKGEVSKTTSVFVRVETVYTFVNTDNPDEQISIVTFGDGWDSQDKAPGKAMTYADKYALLKAYKIITGDDPDQTASEDGSFKKKGISHESFAAARSALYCEDCGQEIKGVRYGGNDYPAEDIASASKASYGRSLCWSCSDAMKKKKNAT